MKKEIIELNIGRIYKLVVWKGVRWYRKVSSKYALFELVFREYTFDFRKRGKEIDIIVNEKINDFTEMLRREQKIRNIINKEYIYIRRKRNDIKNKVKRRFNSRNKRK